MINTNVFRKSAFGILIILLFVFQLIPAGAVQADTALIAPENLKALPVTQTQIQLTWEDKSNNEIRFIIERRTGRSEYFQINTVGNNVTTYIDVSLNAGTTYYYRVAAYGMGGIIAYSNEASANTLLPPNPPPQLFTPGSGYIITTLTPLIQWSAAENAVIFHIQVATDSDFSNLVVDEQDLKTPYYDVPVDKFHYYSMYHWRVRAQDSAGVNTEWSAPWYFRVFPYSLLLDYFCGCGG